MRKEHQAYYSTQTDVQMSKCDHHWEMNSTKSSDTHLASLRTELLRESMDAGSVGTATVRGGLSIVD